MITRCHNLELHSSFFLSFKQLTCGTSCKMLLHNGRGERNGLSVTIAKKHLWHTEIMKVMSTFIWEGNHFSVRCVTKVSHMSVPWKHMQKTVDLSCKLHEKLLVFLLKSVLQFWNSLFWISLRHWKLPSPVTQDLCLAIREGLVWILETWLF